MSTYRPVLTVIPVRLELVKLCSCFILWALPLLFVVNAALPWICTNTLAAFLPFTFHSTRTGGSFLLYELGCSLHELFCVGHKGTSLQDCTHFVLQLWHVRWPTPPEATQFTVRDACFWNCSQRAVILVCPFICFETSTEIPSVSVLVKLTAKLLVMCREYLYFIYNFR